MDLKASRLFVLLREGIDPWDVENNRPYGWRMFYYAMADSIAIVNDLASRSMEEDSKAKFNRLRDDSSPDDSYPIPRDLKDKFAG